MNSDGPGCRGLPAAPAGLARCEVSSHCRDGHYAFRKPGFLLRLVCLSHRSLAPSQMRLASEESFGPVLTVQRARSAQHAVEIANAASQGLASSVWGQDVMQALGVARQLEASLVHINSSTVHDVRLLCPSIESFRYIRPLTSIPLPSSCPFFLATGAHPPSRRAQGVRLRSIQRPLVSGLHPT